MKENAHSETITKISGINVAAKELSECMRTTAATLLPLALVFHTSIKWAKDILAVYQYPCNCRDPDKQTLVEMANAAAGNQYSAYNTKLKQWSGDTVVIACCQNRAVRYSDCFSQQMEYCLNITGNNFGCSHSWENPALGKLVGLIACPPVSGYKHDFAGSY